MYIARGETPCRQTIPEAWFPRSRKNHSPELKRLCLACPELVDCLESTLAFEEKHEQVELGFRAGLTEQQREKILRGKRRRQVA